MSKTKTNTPIEIEFYTTLSGKNLTEMFLDSLSSNEAEKIIGKITAIESLSHNYSFIPKNLLKDIGDKILELRVTGKSVTYRILGFWGKSDQDKVKLLLLGNGFCKKTNKIPQKEKNKAIQLYNEYWSQV